MGFIDGLQHFSCQGFLPGPTQLSPQDKIEDLLKAGLTDQGCCELCHQIMNRSSDVFDGSFWFSWLSEFRQTFNIY